MIVRATLKSVRNKPARLVGTLATYVLTLASLLALISILVATIENPHPTFLLNDVDAVARVNVYDEFNINENEGVGPQSLDARISSDQLAAINAFDGVEQAVGFTIQPVSLMTSDGEKLPMNGISGPSWDLASIEVVDGVVPETGNQVMIAESTAANLGIGPGVQMTLTTSGGPREVIVSGTYAGADKLNEYILMPHHESSPDGFQFITLSLADRANTDDVRDAVSTIDGDYPLGVLTGDDIAKVDPTSDITMVTEFGSLLGVMSGFMGFVSIFVMLSTIGFAIHQRAGQIAIERAVGYTPDQVRRAVIVESCVVVIAGTVLGYLLALPIEAAAVSLARNRGIIPESFDAGIHSIVTLVLLPSMMVLTVGVAWWASRRTLGISPVAAMRDARAPEDRIGIRRWFFGLALISAGLVAVAMSASIPPILAMISSLFLLMFIVWGISLIGPAVIRLAVRLLAPFARLGDAVLGSVAVENTRRMASRVASGTTPVMLGAGFLIMMFFFTATMQQGTVVVSTERESADYHLVSTAGFMPVDTVDRVTGHEGVEAASPMFALELGTLETDEAQDSIAIDVLGYGIEKDTFLQTNSLVLQKGSLEEWKPGTILISDFLLFDSNLTMGGSARIIMPDGSVQTFEVVAVVENTTGSGDVFFHNEDVHAYQSQQNMERVAINLTQDADPDALAAAVEQLEREGYPIKLLSRSEYLQSIDQSLSDGAWATYLIIGSAAALGMIASINTLAMSTLDRSREFALMRLVGATRKQVTGIALREGVIIGVIGVSGGIALAVLSAASVSLALVGDISAIRAPVVSTVLAAGIAFVISVAAVLIPAHLALNKDPMLEIGTRE